MNARWIPPKIIVGSAATGDYYYPRTEIVNEIWDELEKGNFILIAAPRRVGKTSIMRDIEANPRENYKVIFENIQAVKSEIDFYKTLYKLILNCLSTSKKASKWFSSYIKTKQIIEISTSGVKFENKVPDYLHEINNIFRELDKSTETIVLLLDELPEVLHKLDKAEKKDEAIAILHQLRAWRQTDFKKLQFIFAGSVGIHYVVKNIEGRTSSLNDLIPAICNPLSKDEAKDYIKWVTSNNASVQYDTERQTQLLFKIQHYYTPYFINLMLGEIDKNAKKRNNPTITEQDIDQAFLNVEKSNEHFADWKKRLYDYMPKSDFNFVNNILIHIAHRNSIGIQAIYDKAVKQEKTIDYMDMIHDLVNDGYLTETTEDSQKYIFISPFLKAFWKRNNPIYNE
ncbi:AAA-like domain-containing protein [Aquipluma nitroreducens]|nr:AAA-like domain-containing protein [Aquipluma nitroreducens]